jgi:DNA-binding transcriptional LysR family regulator
VRLVSRTGKPTAAARPLVESAREVLLQADALIPEAEAEY